MQRAEAQVAVAVFRTLRREEKDLFNTLGPKDVAERCSL